MIVVIKSFFGLHRVEVNDTPEAIVINNGREAYGHRVLNGDGLLSPSPDVVCLLENTGADTHPWVSSVHMDEESGQPDPKWAVSRIEYQKSWIHHVEQG